MLRQKSMTMTCQKFLTNNILTAIRSCSFHTFRKLWQVSNSWFAFGSDRKLAHAVKLQHFSECTTSWSSCNLWDQKWFHAIVCVVIIDDVLNDLRSTITVWWCPIKSHLSSINCTDYWTSRLAWHLDSCTDRYAHLYTSGHLHLRQAETEQQLCMINTDKNLKSKHINRS